MKKLSTALLAETIAKQRKNLSLTQAQLAQATGIHRTMIGRIENEDYIPTIEQLQRLAQVLDFDITSLFTEESKRKAPPSL